MEYIIEGDIIEWYPDQKMGEFINGKYYNHKVGYDKYGVEYTITEVGLHLLGGFVRLKPGYSILTTKNGEKYVFTRGTLLQATH